MRLLKVATCNLNQWAMDFETNLNNIKESITKAKEGGATIRLGPELEITGYGCEDHFLELDTFTHSWECLKEILVGEWTDGILCSIGMPVIKGSERYNCQVLCMNRKIIMIRPKMKLVNVDNFMEARWFRAWQMSEKLVDFQLPNDLSEAISQKSAPFGYGIIQFIDTVVAAEVCRELFSTFPPHDDLAYNGVEVFLNASGSSFQVGKALNFRLRSLIGVTQNIGGVYVYSNQRGCDGGRLYYDGCSCILVNGEVVALGSQFSLKDVEVMVVQVDLDKVAAKRASTSAFLEQESGKTMIPSITAPYKLCQPFNLKVPLSSPIKISPCSPEKEIALGPACWLWDYLRRSEACGFLLPLFGGPDSSTVAAIVGSMCQLVVEEIKGGNEQVKADAIRIGCYIDGQFPMDNKEFANRIFCTIFMGSANSCESSRKQAKVLAQEIGSWHLDVSIDTIVTTILSVVQKLVGNGSQNKETNIENRGLKDIQARIRMVLAHTLATTLPWVQNKSRVYLVLSSSNGDEALSGQMTKYGCSSADINPIGTLNKQDIQAFLQWAVPNLGYSSLAIFCTTKGDEIAAETTTNEEQSIYGKWRRNLRCGPVSMFQNLCFKWTSSLSPSEVAERVKVFFMNYSINRHKMTVLTPSCHVEKYSIDDNRCDLRQFLYNARWPYQFRKIDQLVQDLQGSDKT